MLANMNDWTRASWLMLRRGLPALALYAMLLQAFLGAAAPSAAGFDPATAPLCNSLGEQGKGGPADMPATGHDCICLSACSHAAHAAGAPAGPTLPIRATADAARATVRPAFQHIPAPAAPGLGARAPPSV